MSLVVKKENGKFNYYRDGELFRENLKVIIDKRKGDGVTDGDIVLPENSYGKKWLSTTKFSDGVTEIDLANIPARAHSNSTTTSPKKPKVDLSEYYTDEEKARIEELQSEINKINETAATRAKVKAEQEVLKNALMALDSDTLKALLDSINA